MENVGIKRIHLVVYGRVQGVGFRFFTATVAARYQVHGFVRNRIDGTVEIDAEAPGTALQAFIAEIHRGPNYGHVDHVAETPLPPKGYRSFDIAR